MEERENWSYVGDGVYVEFNGYNIDIHVNHHENPTAVVFEREVLQSLVDFVRSNGWKIK